MKRHALVSLLKYCKNSCQYLYRTSCYFVLLISFQHFMSFCLMSAVLPTFILNVLCFIIIITNFFVLFVLLKSL